MGQVIAMYPAEDRFTTRRTAANLSSGPEYVPEAPMCHAVDLSPPPFWVARRRQMRRDGLMVIACAVMGLFLVYMAVTPDQVRVLPQEQTQ